MERGLAGMPINEPGGGIEIRNKGDTYSTSTDGLPLNENEKVVYNLLSDVKVNLSKIKEKSALSNKAWDKSTKSLRKLGLISVEKKDDNLYIFRLK